MTRVRTFILFGVAPVQGHGQRRPVVWVGDSATSQELSESGVDDFDEHFGMPDGAELPTIPGLYGAEIIAEWESANVGDYGGPPAETVFSVYVNRVFRVEDREIRLLLRHCAAVRGF